MKKMVLALMLAMLGLAALDANAFGWRRRGCGNACETPCETSCVKTCSPCTKFRVIDEPSCPPPVCEKKVVCTVRKPAVCIRSCRWVCPEDCQTVGEHAGEYHLVGGDAGVE